jgi:hypothetical protein
MFLAELSDRRKAVLQRFIIGSVHDEMANKKLYDAYFVHPEQDFTKPVELNVRLWHNWIVKIDRLERRLKNVYNIMKEYIVSGRLSKPDDYLVIGSKVLFSRLLDFEFANIVVISNELYNLKTLTNDAPDVDKPAFKYGRVKLAAETFHVFDKINALFEFTSDRSTYQNLRLYSNGKCYVLNSTMFMNAWEPRPGYKGSSTIDPYSGTSIEKLVEEMNVIMTRTRGGVVGILQDSEPLYVYRGGEFPWINATDDIFTIPKPFIYECPAFFSTSADYKVTLDSKYIGQVVWQLLVRTANFVSLGHMEWSHEKELLFGPGQKIEVSAVSMNEEGRVVVHGALIDETETQNGGAYCPLKSRNPIAGVREDPEISIIKINEKRSGTLDSPFLFNF